MYMYFRTNNLFHAHYSSAPRITLYMHGMCWSMHVSDTLYQLGSLIYLKLNTTYLKSPLGTRTCLHGNKHWHYEELVTLVSVTWMM